MSEYRDRLLGFLKSSAPATRQALFAGEIAPTASSSPRDTSIEALRSRFRNELEALSGEVLDGTCEQSPTEAIGRWLTDFQGMRVAFDADPGWRALDVDLDALIFAAGGKPVPVDGASGAAPLADVDLGVTIADAAIAETGTIAQCARPFRPRSLSLVPAAHLVVIPEDRWAVGFEDFYSRIGAGSSDQPSSNRRFSGDWDSYFTWITGPSRTADIEKTLTVGIHGPKRLFAAFVAGAVDEDS